MYNDVYSNCDILLTEEEDRYYHASYNKKVTKAKAGMENHMPALQLLA